MAFTYDVSTSLGQLRLAIGDTKLNEGPRPDGTNYTDAELGVFLLDARQAVCDGQAAVADGSIQLLRRVLAQPAGDFIG